MDVKLMNATASVLFLGALVLGLVGLVKWVARQPLFAIGGIAVVGDVAHNNEVTLRANLNGKIKGTFFTVDLAATKAAFESVPWVRKAVVRREFPNRLKVVLQEQQAVAYWGDEDESRLLNNFGEVFEANVDEVERDDLPHLDGPVAQAGQILGMYQTLSPLFAPLDMALDQLTLTNRGGWRAQTNAGGEIELGRGTTEEITQRAQRFIGTVAQVATAYGRTADALERADLRYGEGYALRLRGVTTVATPVATPKKKQAEH
ncbi:cell division protein FtsQ/DivIB [Rhodoferax sp. OV413]|uniref:cell division protein FtsQ/DivIB n=1 Tax=Rhodoferax sp. OV413 TaxID=1855285 RepID=UPI00351866C0